VATNAHGAQCGRGARGNDVQGDIAAGSAVAINGNLIRRAGGHREGDLAGENPARIIFIVVAAMAVSAFTAVPWYTPNVVSNWLPAVEMVAVPVTVAVQDHQTDLPPVTLALLVRRFLWSH